MSNFSSDVLKKILNKINKYDDSEIAIIMDYFINKSVKDVYDKNFDSNTIGYQSDINGCISDITNKDALQKIVIYGNPFWVGFIPSDIKIVYCFEIKDYAISNSGYYYYMNDKNYIYDFARYIKNKNIEDDSSFISYLTDYIYKYFSTLKEKITREQLHQLIYDTNNKFYKPNKEHSITDFKGNGSAKCSEYSAMLQNLLSVFGYDSIYIHGELDDYEEKHSSHAFNIAVIDGDFALIDLSLPVNCIDYIKKTQKQYPYIYCLKGFSEDNLDDFLFGDKELVLDDLFAQIINNKYYSFVKNRKRVYRVSKMNLENY